MQIPPFEHLAPDTLADALSLLARYKEEAKVIAGGTELLPKMKKKILRPRVLVNIKFKQMSANYANLVPLEITVFLISAFFEKSRCIGY